MIGLARKPADAYRRIDLDARIEASAGEGLTQICIEEAVTAISQALMAIEREPQNAPTERIARAQAIALWLARSVAPDNPLHDAMVQFYAGLAARLGRNMTQPDASELALMRDDFADLLEAAQTA